MTAAAAALVGASRRGGSSVRSRGRDRDEKSGGSGLVPLEACWALAQIAEPRALQPMEDWLEFLLKNDQIYPLVRDRLIRGTEKRIGELKSKIKEMDK